MNNQRLKRLCPNCGKNYSALQSPAFTKSMCLFCGHIWEPSITVNPQAGEVDLEAMAEKYRPSWMAKAGEDVEALIDECRRLRAAQPTNRETPSSPALAAYMLCSGCSFDKNGGLLEHCERHREKPDEGITSSEGPGEEDGPWAEGWLERSQGSKDKPNPNPAKMEVFEYDGDGQYPEHIYLGYADGSGGAVPYVRRSDVGPDGMQTEAAKAAEAERRNNMKRKKI